MASFLTSLYLFSFKQGEVLHDSDLDCIKVSSKTACTQSSYPDSKNDFIRSRCSIHKTQWRKNIKAMEKLFRSYKCIFMSWNLNQPILLFFSNGSIVSIELNSENNSLKSVEIDNNLCGKLIASRIVDALICENYIFITYSEPKLTFINVTQETPSLSSKLLGKKKGKLVGFEPKVYHVDLIGPCSKNLERKLSINSHKDHLLIWWKFSEDDVWPWTPVSHASDRVNILVYELRDCPEILCTIKVNGELIDAKYSSYFSNQILTIVEMKNEKVINIYVSVYEILNDQCHHSSMSQLPLQGKVLSFHWSSNDKLLISDSNNLLLIYDLRKKTSIVTNLLFTPKHVIWHPQDCVALVVGITSQVQCFDTALTCIKLKMFYNSFSDCDVFELNSKFAQSFIVQHLIWQKSSSNSICLLLDTDSSFVFLKFTVGSISKNCLSVLELITQYLKCNCIDESILLLRSMNWSYESDVHFQCLSKVANFLLRKPLNLQTQSGLELALGTFYTNMECLPKKILRTYQLKVNHLARRFFHHLLRFQQFRKAFLLAVDLESQDLFLDLSHVAKQKGENVLAFVALHKANELKSLEHSDSNSYTDSVSLSGSSVASGDDGEWERSSSTCERLCENINFENSYDQQYSTPKLGKDTGANGWFNSSQVQSIASNKYCQKYDSFRKSDEFLKRSGHLNVPQLSNEGNSNSSNKLNLISSVYSRPLSQIPVSHRSVDPSYYISNSVSPVSYERNQILNSDLSRNRNVVTPRNRNMEEEIEDIEDARIKLVHFGII